MRVPLPLSSYCSFRPSSATWHVAPELTPAMARSSCCAAAAKEDVPRCAHLALCTAALGFTRRADAAAAAGASGAVHFAGVTRSHGHRPGVGLVSGRHRADIEGLGLLEEGGLDQQPVRQEAPTRALEGHLRRHHDRSPALDLAGHELLHLVGCAGRRGDANSAKHAWTAGMRSA